MLVAGNETTTKLIGSAMLQLLEHPDALDAVLADASLIPHLIEETLRIESPVQGLFRVAARDTELGGVPIPAGRPLVMLYGSGNRDDAAFADAARFDLRRDHSRAHLAFGLGTHYCVGAALSKAEGRIAFEALLERLHNVRLERPGQQPYEHNFVFRGLEELRLVFDTT